MKWFLLCVILKLLTITRSAPIDIEDTKNDLEKFINKGYTVAQEAENATSILNESLSQEFQNVSDKIKHFTTKILQDFEEQPIEKSIVQGNKENSEIPTTDYHLESETESNPNEEKQLKLEFDGKGGYNKLPNQTHNLIESVKNQEAEQNSLDTLVTSTENNSEATSHEAVAVISGNFNSIFKENSSDSTIAPSQEPVTVEIYPSTLVFEHSTLDSQEETSKEHEASLKKISGSVHNNATTADSIENSLQKLENVYQLTTEAANDEGFNLKPSLDSFTQKLEDLGSSVSQTTAGLESLSTLLSGDPNANTSETTEFSPNYPHISNDNLIMESAEFKKTQAKQSPTFKDAVDSFIADVMEIGGNLGLINETDNSTQNNQQSLNFFPEEKIAVESSLAASTEEYATSLPQINVSDKSQVNLQGSPEDQTKEEPVISLSSQTIMNSSLSAENNYETFQNSDSSFLDKSVENLIDSMSELANNIGKTETATEKEQQEIPSIAEFPNYPFSIPAENVKDVSLELFNTDHAKNAGTFGTFAPQGNQQSVKRTNDEILTSSQKPLENESLLLNQDLSQASQNFQESENINQGSDMTTVSQSSQEIDKANAKQVSISTSQDMLDTTESITQRPELRTASQISQEMENISHNPELTPASSDFQKVENQNLQETKNINLNQEATARNSDFPEVENITHYPEVNAVSQSSPEVENVSSTQEVENITQEIISKNAVGHDGESQTTQVTLNFENTKTGNIKRPADNEQYIAVAIASDLEEKNKSSSSNFSENIQTQSDTKSQNSTPVLENQTFASQEELTENTTKGDFSPRISTTGKSESSPNSFPNSEESITSEATPSIFNIKQEANSAFKEFENSLKTLIEKNTLKKEETHAANPEHSQIETTTSAAVIEEKHSPASIDETTALPKKFEEELQMAVKALEETTHQHFEQFQNNLKKAFKKFAILGMEQEKSLEGTTQKPEVVDQTTFIVTTDKETKYFTSEKIVEDTTSASIKISREDSYKTEEPRSGAIHQQFVDTFEENSSTTEMTNESEQYLADNHQTTELPVDKHESSIHANNMENETTDENTTQMPLADKALDNQTAILTNEKKERPDRNLDYSSLESTTELEESSTEFIADTTVSTVVSSASQLMQENASNENMADNQLKEAYSDPTTTEAYNLATQQQSLLQQENNNNSKVTETGQHIAIEEDLITTTYEYPEITNLGEMVKFIEKTERTTPSTPITTEVPILNQQKEQLTLTQASFMEEQQQQIESTTAPLAKTPSTDSQDESATFDETTKEEIPLTTINIEQDKDATTVSPEFDGSAEAEPEARSLSLTPPKLEYLQNEDGVEVFYGYSIVNHN